MILRGGEWYLAINYTSYIHDNEVKGSSALHPLSLTLQKRLNTRLRWRTCRFSFNSSLSTAHDFTQKPGKHFTRTFKFLFVLKGVDDIISRGPSLSNPWTLASWNPKSTCYCLFTQTHNVDTKSQTAHVLWLKKKRIERAATWTSQLLGMQGRENKKLNKHDVNTKIVKEFRCDCDLIIFSFFILFTPPNKEQMSKNTGYSPRQVWSKCQKTSKSTNSLDFARKKVNIKKTTHPYQTTAILFSTLFSITWFFFFSFLWELLKD